MNEDLYLIRKVDANYVREAFLKIHSNNKEDVLVMIRNYRVLAVLADEIDWIRSNILGIVNSKRNAKVFMGLLKDKLRNAEINE